MSQLGVHAFDGPRVTENRIVDMYHSHLLQEDQTRILEQFTSADGKMRFLIATVAFGMGMDVGDVSVVFHWGASDTVLSYWQEVGRCGRDGRAAEAYFYATRTSIRYCQDDMRKFCQEVSSPNKSCFRLKILEILSVPGMDRSSLLKMERRPQCTSLCTDCSCECCACCSLCRSKCPCRNQS